MATYYLKEKLYNPYADHCIIHKYILYNYTEVREIQTLSRIVLHILLNL